MKVANAEKIRRADKITIEGYGIPGIVLMENASQGVARVCLKELEGIKDPKVLVIAGKGNNGGDGYAAARLLKNNGVKCEIVVLGDLKEIKGDAKINLDVAHKINIPITNDISNIDEKIKNADIVLDAIFGTGFAGQAREPHATIIEKINKLAKKVVSVDIPSGVNADNGHTDGSCIMADVTVTFALPKLGNLLYPGAENTGRLEVIDISIPEQVIDTLRIDTNYLTEEEAKALLPKRRPRSNKGTYGKLLIVAGSEKMPGAAFLAGKSAYRTGVGLVYSGIVYHRRKVFQQLLPEAICLSLDDYEGTVYDESYDGIADVIDDMTAIAVGPGLGNGKYVKDFVERVLRNAKVPVIIDADGLNAISKNPDVLRKTSRTPIITPHPGEMSRLTGLAVKEILADPIECARRFAINYNTITVLKDARTIIAHPDGRVYINLTGNNAMAKGGSGDVLTGIISALVAQGMDSFNAACLGCFIHGKAGDMAAEDIGHYGVLARDLCEYTAKVIKSME
ncbi:MAG: NAD(P)H-hydrate dehydratase [Firmicutes bacterium]|nr:NAD(P)H-hydrate dehydratase [Bacillota bacterium]